MERNRFNIYVYPKKGREVGLVRRFSVPIINVYEEEMPELQTDYEATATLKADALVDAIDLIDKVSDWVQITVAPNGVAFRGVGDAGKTVEYILTQRDEGLLNLTASDAVSSKFSTETIKSFVSKMKAVSKSVEISIASDKPGTFKYYFGVGELKVIVAPRAD